MRAADLAVRCLEDEGVEYVFGLPGEEIAELLRALGNSKKIKFVLCAHEQAASFMADVYGRLTGRAGVCLSTLGPGATNLLTGVADSFLDRAPVVAITGQGGLERTYEESHQYIDIVSVYKFVTKWNRTITRAAFIPQVLRKAFSVAQSEKAGAVHIELPEDVAEEMIDAKNSLPIEPTEAKVTTTITEESSRYAINLIRNAKFPLILAGNGVIRAKASEDLRRFAKELSIPVASTFMGKGVISDNDILSLGTIGLQTKDLINCAFDKSDLVLCVGYDFVEYAPKFWNPSPRLRKKIVHIDSSPAEIDRNYKPCLELLGNLPATLQILTTEARSRKGRKSSTSGYTKRLRRRIWDELYDYSEDDSFPLKPQRILCEIRRALRPEDILVSDVGMHKTWIGRLFPAYLPNTVIISNGFASMGIALPGAIAAKVAKPNCNVLAACGDGGFLMTLYDLATARALNLAITILVFDDGKYSQIDWKQQAKFGRSYFVDFENPDIVKIAESFGCRAIRVKNAIELRKSLSISLKSNTTWVIDVPVDSQENFKLSRRLGDNVRCPK
jgi:acetolactate synthase-1/2/3 large subunit